MLEHRGLTGLFDDPLAASGIAQGGDALGERELGDLDEARLVEEGVERVPGQQQSAGPVDRHRDELRPLAVGGVRHLEELPPELGLDVVLGDREEDGAAGVEAHLSVEGELAAEAVRVFAHQAGGHDLEEAAAVLLGGLQDRVHLPRLGEGSGDGFAARRGVERDAIAREGDRTGVDGLGGEPRHLGDLCVARRAVHVAVVADRIGPECAVRQLGRDLDRAGLRGQRVEILREALPGPLDPVVERGPGNVLDAFHQVDEDVLVVRPDRREADAAVAHHDGRHAVVRGGGEAIVPGRLAVVVGVRIDESGSDEEALGLDDFRGVRGLDRPRFGDGFDPAVRDGPDAPARVALFGPTGAGKSKLFSSILGRPVSSSGFRRPFTRRAVYFVHEAWRALTADLTGEVEAHEDDVWRELILIDTPDFDSVELENRDEAERVFREVDAFVFVTDSLKYADASTWEYLTRIRAAGKTRILVVNKLPSEAVEQSFRDRYRETFGEPLAETLVTFPELAIDDDTPIPEDEPSLAVLRSAVLDLAHLDGQPLPRRMFRVELESSIGEAARLSAEVVETRGRDRRAHIAARGAAG